MSNHTPDYQLRRYYDLHEKRFARRMVRRGLGESYLYTLEHVRQIWEDTEGRLKLNKQKLIDYTRSIMVTRENTCQP